MPQTPRDIDAFLTDFNASVSSNDPSLDVQKGPLAVMAFGAATEGSRMENFAAYLGSLYQLSDPSLILDEDMFELALNFGKDPNVARVSRVTVYFFRNVRPEAGEVYVASVGTIVSTDDGRFNFTVIEDASMNGDLADVYFNSDSGQYEVPVICEAIAAGTDYDLPPNTINSIQTVQDDFDGCINRDYASRGEDPPDKFQMRDIIQTAMQGANQDIAGQIENLITSISPTGADDYSLVSSVDYVYYSRLGQTSGKLGYDVYVITDRNRETIDRGTADGGETFLSFQRKPVLSVIFVAVDGVQVPFSLDVDTDAAWRGSPRANDRVELATPLQPGQVWEMRYIYYDVIYDVDSLVQDRVKIFGSDTLIRLADAIDIFVAGEVGVFATADRDTIIGNVITFTEGYLRNPNNPSQTYQQYTTFLDPTDYQRAIEGNVDGVQNFKLTRFARLDGAVQDIEFISLNGLTEYPVLSVNSDIT
ncbi:hypothetical protein LCGC14_0607880 [marine sediment metagenome]|uniref:Baseplate protein J-like domain-containing protein n=1 Tax=marine sediment metagenome TaxID=412755 RepID=A0A0F9RSQ9_9ZZZZ